MKLFTKGKLALAALLLGTTLGANAASWPANYQGVMLQGFYWDAYKQSGYGTTKWTDLTNQADELSKYFSLIWVPNSAQANGENYGGNGYMPIYWFTNHRCAYGTEAELKTMISTFKAKGTGIIEDCVINHRVGKSNWYDFPSETWNGSTYYLTDGAICSTDEMWRGGGQGCPFKPGNPDEGEDFDGARDLDHTNANVQNNCKAYVKFLTSSDNGLGYAGLRYDMVKGYAGYYTGMYNANAGVQFSVGEYWDGEYDNVARWIDQTGEYNNGAGKSAAFDFPGKYAINEAFRSNDMTKLAWSDPSGAKKPAGMIHYGYTQYAVTFVDNHDTFRDGSKFPSDANIVAANAFILLSPGTPCVFWPHYYSNKSAIQALINARNSVGIHNLSNVNVLQCTNNCYAAEITGTKGKAVVKIGSDTSFNPGSGYNIVASGTNYCVWSTNSGGYDPGTGGGGNTGGNTGGDVNIYFKNDKGWSTPYIHYWGGSESSWPGVAMSKSGDVWKYTCPAGTTGILFNAGDGDPSKTPDFVAYNNHIYTTSGDQGEYSGAGTGGGGNTGGGNTGGGSAPSTLYVIGEVNGNEWDPGKGVTLTKSGNVFYGDITVTSTGANGYFSFAKSLASSWDELNVAGNRYAPSSDTQLTLNNPSTLMESSNPAEAKAYYAATGDYAVLVDFGAMTVTLAPKGTKPSDGGGGNTGGGGDTGGGNTGGGGGSVTMPAALYLVGNFPGCQWDPNLPIEMEKGTSGFLARNVELVEGNEGYGYWSFLTVKAALPADFDTDPTNPFDWDGPQGGNSGDRFGSSTPNYPLSVGQSADMVLYAAGVNASACTSWMSPIGKYDIVADFGTGKVSLVAAGTGKLPNGGESSVQDILNDFNGEPEYYNLQGIRVYEPTQGIYIVRRGNKITKEVVR